MQFASCASCATATSTSCTRPSAAKIHFTSARVAATPRRRADSAHRRNRTLRREISLTIPGSSVVAGAARRKPGHLRPPRRLVRIVNPDPVLSRRGHGARRLDGERHREDGPRTRPLRASLPGRPSAGRLLSAACAAQAAWRNGPRKSRARRSRQPKLAGQPEPQLGRGRSHLLNGEAGTGRVGSPGTHGP